MKPNHEETSLSDAWSDDYVNVIDYGATPDFSTDSTDAFNDAIATNKAVYIPDGFYKVNEDIDLSMAVGIGVVINSNTYRRLVFNQNQCRNKYSKILGSQFSNGGSNTSAVIAWTTERITSCAEALGLIKYKPYNMTLHQYVDADGDFKICEFDNTDGGFSETEWDAATGIIESYGSLPVMVKFHAYVTTLDITGYSKFFTDYLANVERLCIKYQDTGVKYFVMSNEAEDLTSVSDYDAEITAIINMVKSYEFKVGMSYAGLDDAGLSLYNDQLDFIGVNFYPSCGSKSLETTIEEVKDAFQTSLGAIAALKAQYPDKEFMITEFSCQDYTNSLERPSWYEWTGEVTNDGMIQRKFFQGAIESFNDLERVLTYTFAWDSGELFCPYLHSSQDALNYMLATFK